VTGFRSQVLIEAYFQKNISLSFWACSLWAPSWEGVGRQEKQAQQEFQHLSECTRTKKQTPLVSFTN